MGLNRVTENTTREELLAIITEQRQALRDQEQALQVERQKKVVLRFVLRIVKILLVLPVELETSFCLDF